MYKINCKDCNKCYIGQTSRYLKERAYQHRYNLKRPTSEHTALTTHAIDNDHFIDYNSIRLLKTENNSYKRNILEMIYIEKNSHITMKKRIDTKSLHKCYPWRIRGHSKMIVKRR
ncbi:GSCOCG00012558001-RA-CDS [Cotesia congregata]|nr:GSCOCG00012558001-RA-CDS [Cotesia congregata]